MLLPRTRTRRRGRSRRRRCRRWRRRRACRRRRRRARRGMRRHWSGGTAVRYVYVCVRTCVRRRRSRGWMYRFRVCMCVCVWGGGAVVEMTSADQSTAHFRGRQTRGNATRGHIAVSSANALVACVRACVCVHTQHTSLAHTAGAGGERGAAGVRASGAADADCGGATGLACWGGRHQRRRQRQQQRQQQWQW